MSKKDSIQVLFDPKEDMTVQELAVLLHLMAGGMLPWQTYYVYAEWWDRAPSNVRRHFSLAEAE